MKSCLVVLRNKKIFSERAEYYSCLRAFAAEGLYFDKIAVVAYDGSAEITSQLRDCRENFNVSVVLCPQTMEGTLKGFLQPLYGGTFDMSHALETGERSVYLVFSERPDFVTPAKHIALKSGRKFAKAYIKAVGAPHEEILAAVREEVIAECRAKGDIITLRFNDGTVPTVDLGFLLVVFWSIEMAVLRPSI